MRSSRNPSAEANFRRIQLNIADPAVPLDLAFLQSTTECLHIFKYALEEKHQPTLYWLLHHIHGQLTSITPIEEALIREILLKAVKSPRTSSDSEFIPVALRFIGRVCRASGIKTFFLDLAQFQANDDQQSIEISRKGNAELGIVAAVSYWGYQAIFSALEEDDFPSEIKIFQPCYRQNFLSSLLEEMKNPHTRSFFFSHIEVDAYDINYYNDYDDKYEKVYSPDKEKQNENDLAVAIRQNVAVTECVFLAPRPFTSARRNIQTYCQRNQTLKKHGITKATFFTEGASEVDALCAAQPELQPFILHEKFQRWKANREAGKTDADLISSILTIANDEELKANIVYLFSPICVLEDIFDNIKTLTELSEQLWQVALDMVATPSDSGRLLKILDILHKQLLADMTDEEKEEYISNQFDITSDFSKAFLNKSRLKYHLKILQIIHKHGVQISDDIIKELITLILESVAENKKDLSPLVFVPVVQLIRLFQKPDFLPFFLSHFAEERKDPYWLIKQVEGFPEVVYFLLLTKSFISGELVSSVIKKQVLEFIKTLSWQEKYQALEFALNKPTTQLYWFFHQVRLRLVPNEQRGILKEVRDELTNMIVEELRRDYLAALDANDTLALKTLNEEINIKTMLTGAQLELFLSELSNLQRLRFLRYTNLLLDDVKQAAIKFKDQLREEICNITDIDLKRELLTEALDKPASPLYHFFHIQRESTAPSEKSGNLRKLREAFNALPAVAPVASTPSSPVLTASPSISTVTDKKERTGLTFLSFLSRPLASKQVEKEHKQPEQDGMELKELKEPKR